jgi:hypothetical protein
MAGHSGDDVCWRLVMFLACFGCRACQVSRDAALYSFLHGRSLEREHSRCYNTF